MQRFVLSTLSLLVLATSADAYAFSAPVSVGASSRTAFRSATCLRAAEGADDKASDDGASDILNSPVFLQKKLDVIKSDLAKVDEKMAAEKTRLEEGKAEWGGQLDDLKKEVRAS
jgi:flagellar motility protein MotE (MotC chaperone)